LPPPTMERRLPAVRAVGRRAYDGVVSHPREAYANRKLGIVLHAHNLLTEAEVCYRRAHLLEPTSFRLIYYLALVQMDQAKCNEAVAAFRQALQLQPDYLPAQLRSGECLLASANWEEAGKLYESLVQKHPESAEAH